MIHDDCSQGRTTSSLNWTQGARQELGDDNCGYAGSKQTNNQGPSADTQYDRYLDVIHHI
jgi:hypothetical protein